MRLNNIKCVEPAGEQEADANLGTDGQLLFRLAEPTPVYGLFGRVTQATTIRIGVDEPELLAAHLGDHGVKVGEAT